MITGRPGLSVVWVMFPKTERVRSHKSRAGTPSNLNPTSNEMTSDSVELCETEVCFLHIQLIGTNVWLPKNAQCSSRSGFFNPQDLPRSQSLETVPICIVWQYYPHDNTVCVHKYDEYMKSIDSGVCHRLWSILLWIVRAYLLTIKYQVVQFLPNISILEHFESIHVTFLQQISFLLLWSGGHRCME